MELKDTKTWQQLAGPTDIFQDDRKKNRVIGMSFPANNKSLGLEPSILTVLPDGDNVEYAPENLEFNDNDVLFYACSVYITGMDEFKAWAAKHDRNKIIVGGYHPSTFPEDFEPLARYVVVGPCDDLWATIGAEFDDNGKLTAQKSEKVLPGVVSYQRIPRYDLYDVRNNQQIIPDKHPDDVVTSINTSMGCPMKCDFCCSPILCPKLISKPIDLVAKEVDYLSTLQPKFLFIRDENFPLQPDWKERLSLIAKTGAKIYLFASANLVTEDMVQHFKACNVYMVCLGLEDITVEYAKNKALEQAVGLLKQHGIYTYLSFIVNPLKIVGAEAGKDFYERLIARFHELKPEMVCGNFLMPFRGTKLWDEYYHLVSPDDYRHYDSKSAFLVKNPIVRQKMEFFMFWQQYQYFTSDFYRDNVRNFQVGDTLQLRFDELLKEFRPKYERLWDKRA